MSMLHSLRYHGIIILLASVLLAFSTATVTVDCIGRRPRPSSPLMNSAAQRPPRTCRPFAVLPTAEARPSPTACPVPYAARYPSKPLTPEQMNGIRLQIAVWVAMEKGLPLPEQLLQAVRAHNQAQAMPNPQTLPHGPESPDVNTCVYDSMVKIHNDVDVNPVNDAVEKSPTEVAAPPQPDKEEVEVVDPEKGGKRDGLYHPITYREPIELDGTKGGGWSVE